MNSLSDVEYREIDGFPGYRVGNDGSVWSNRTHGTGNMSEKWKQLKSKPNPNYCTVTLVRDRIKFTRLVHRLVLEAFVGECPDGMQACHDPDHTTSNNHLSNLRWGTPKENHADINRHGRRARGSKQGSSKLSESQVLEIKTRIARGESRLLVANLMGVSRRNVAYIATGQSWTHVLLPENVA